MQIKEQFDTVKNEPTDAFMEISIMRITEYNQERRGYGATENKPKLTDYEAV